MKNYITYITLFVSIFLCFGSSSANLKTYEEFVKGQEVLKKQAEHYPMSYVKKSYTGIDIMTNKKNECEIVDVAKGSPADLAGIKSGDIILKVDGRVIKNRYEFFKIYTKKSPGDNLQIDIHRDGKIIDKQFKLETHYLPYDLYIITELVFKGTPIRLAVIPTEINFSHKIYQKEIGQYENSFVSSAINLIEGMFKQLYGKQDNFNIVDKQHTDSVLSELKYQASGLFSDELRVKLGEMLGVTHLLTINYTWPGEQVFSYNYILTRKLIEVKSGKVLATVLSSGSADILYNTEQKDIVEYENKLAKIFPLENEIMNTYSNVTGINFKDDKILHDTLINSIIPKYRIVVQQHRDVSPMTVELKNLDSLYIEGVNLQLLAFENYKTALEKRDMTLMNKAHEDMSMGRLRIEEWQRRFQEVTIKLNLNY